MPGPHFRFHVVVLALLLGVGMPAGAHAETNSDDPSAPGWFESHVHPLLVRHCIACHGPEKQEAGLRLDSAQALGRGADSGPVIVPGQVEASALVRAVRYEGDIQMPPEGRLDEEAIATLVAWIASGANWPATSAPSETARFDEPYYDEIAQSHWAFRPVARTAFPAARNESWPRRGIDRFVLAALEGRSLAPSAEADRRTWLRRVTFDLHGLPPTSEELDAFTNDASTDARERVVERLLASPRYGQRWGRHWLDIARYADTKGYVFTQDPRYPYAYTYRDWVIRSLNEDLPYDQFVVQQLAADLLPGSAEQPSLAALGFLTLGRRFMNNIHDIIDDRIDVVGRGLLGLTVGCARCHDHKYDPVPMEDYYALYGVFANSVEPDDLPIIAPAADRAAHAEHQARLAAMRAELDRFVAAQIPRLVDEFRAHVAEYLAAASLPEPPPPREDPMLSYIPGDIRREIVERWRKQIAAAGVEHPVWGLWNRLAALPEENFAAAAWEILVALDTKLAGAAPASENLAVAAAFRQHPPQSRDDIGRRYGAAMAESLAAWGRQHRSAIQAAAAGRAAAPPARLADDAQEELRQILWAGDGALALKPEDVRPVLDRAAANEHDKLKKAIGDFEAQAPVALARAMALADAGAPQETHIFLRGNPHRPGPVVPRRFLRVLAGKDRANFAGTSGRLDLARAIVAPSNPLTPRVIANRVWLHHFGRGLVDTPSDFGLRGEAPSHPELLDYLAALLMDDGWSLKNLHREIVLSRTYAQASATRADAAEVDPENRLLWRMNRRRLEFEALRDSVLAIAGRLDDRLEGRSEPLFQSPFSTRRAVYGWIDRQDLPGTLRVFDFASPDTSTPMRPRTTVPQQALFLMNSDFLLEQAAALAARSAQPGVDKLQRIARLYRWVLGRDPRDEETRWGVSFIDAQATSPPAGDAVPRFDAWARYAQALLLTNEFAFVD